MIHLSLYWSLSFFFSSRVHHLNHSPNNNRSIKIRKKKYDVLPIQDFLLN